MRITRNGQNHWSAAVAQLAEQLFCKQQVTGSIPVGGSNIGGETARVHARARSQQVGGQELQHFAVCSDLIRQGRNPVTLVLEDQQLRLRDRLRDLDAFPTGTRGSFRPWITSSGALIVPARWIGLISRRNSDSGPLGSPYSFIRSTPRHGGMFWKNVCQSAIPTVSTPASHSSGSSTRTARVMNPPYEPPMAAVRVAKLERLRVRAASHPSLTESQRSVLSSRLW